MAIKYDNRPLYLKVVDRLKSDISNGVYMENEQLPSEFELSKKLGISRATLREALRFLEEESVITKKHGVGTFVKRKPLFTSGIEQLNSITKMIKQAKMTPGTIYLNSKVVPATSDDIEIFSCLEDDEILQIDRLRTANDEPVVYCIDKIPQAILKSPFTFENESIFSTLENVAERRITYAMTEVVPLGYDEKVSPLLNCEDNCAMLVLKQTHYDDQDEVILYSINYFKADAFKFHVLRRRD